ncbi:IMPACT family protein [candidate division KSB1 bacterium]|nr:IMPACT family protein [candidate division KSB1 bacterium]
MNYENTPTPDSYLTIRQPVAAQLKEKGSRFLGWAAPVENKAEAQTFLTQTAKKYFDATHHCYAYRLGVGVNTLARYSDAGEPTGTAGLPIYQVIEGRNLSNLMVIVTRYFGGVKLGKGGLVRAYRDTTVLTLDQAQIIEKFITNQVRVQIPYARTGEVLHLIQQLQGTLQFSDYAHEVTLIVTLRQSLVTRFSTKLIELTQNQVKIETVN